MDAVVHERHILDWDESDVYAWFTSLGFPQYEAALRENNISGDVLCMLDAEGLKAIGVATVGQRLSILKAVYQTKLAHNVPIEPDHYVPPSEAQNRLGDVTLEKLYEIVTDQAHRLQYLEELNRRLSENLHPLLEEYNHLQTPHAPPDETSLRRQASFKWAQYRSPNKHESLESPHPSPQRLEHDIAPLQRTAPQTDSQTSPVDKPRTNLISANDSSSSSASQLRPHRSESTEALKGFKVVLDDPTWKVLPAALKKYKIHNDNWQNYAMFICYGAPGARIERCLSYDEKPLLLFQKLKDAKKHPVFVLKHIKDIRSPIAVAQAKQAARKASASESTSSTQGHAKKSSTGGGGRPAQQRPPRLEVNDLSATPVLGGTSPQPGWLEVMTPTTGGTDEMSVAASAFTGSTMSSVSSNGAVSRVTSHAGDVDTTRVMPPPSSGVSYAVAIYPYMAEQEDEFDVIVGDTFVILSRARGWWVVQRDPTGAGLVDPDMSKQGWVPAGCLLETNVPVASAIAEANAANASHSGSPPSSPVNKTPILPLSIISTSFPGIALMEYQKKGEEELDLAKDDLLRVFKRYNHWSYAVKEEGGDRGWVPSWFIGKVPMTGGTPATPSTSVPPMTANSIGLDTDSGGTTQVSPMSSAFPPNQRLATVP